MSSHDQFRDDLPAYAARRLKGEEMQRLEEHLEVCDECERVAAVWSDLAAVMRGSGDALFDPHPSVAELRQAATWAADAANERIRRHLDVCASCELEVRMWDRRHAANGRGDVPERRRSAFAIAWVSAAAGILLGVGIATLWRSWDGSTQTTAIEPSSWTGPTAQILLPSILRGETPPLVAHHIGVEERRVVIAFPLVDSDIKGGDGSYRFEIVGAASGPVLSQVLTGADILRHLEAASVVTIDVSADRLPQDRYECKVTGPGGEVLYRAAIEILPVGG